MTCTKPDHSLEILGQWVGKTPCPLCSLESELAKARAEIERLKVCINTVQDERAASFAMLNKAVGGTGLTEYQPEIDILIEARIKHFIASNAELRAGLKRLEGNLRSHHDTFSTGIAELIAALMAKE